jgi:hypothetical protein
MIGLCGSVRNIGEFFRKESGAEIHPNPACGPCPQWNLKFRQAL